MLSEQPTLATRGMVATAHYLATQAGIQMLQRGGNAIDAAIAANAAMTVVYPSTCSAGGDVFMLIWEARTQKLHALNGSGRAPGNLTPGLLAARGLRHMPPRGPLSINVPGAVDGWFEAMARFGTLSAETIFAPAIDLAQEGMPVSPKLSEWLEAAAEVVLGPWSSSIETYLMGGKHPQAGTVLRQPNLARTYKLLSQEGRDAFYRGPLTHTITEYIQQCGGVLSPEDMATHHSDWVEPISTNYRGYEVYEFPPNSQGIAALEMLNIIEGYDLKALGYHTAEYLHILLEAKKLAFADRDRYVSDPAFVDVPVEHLLSKDYAAQQRQRISLTEAAHHVGPGEMDGDTMYLCTADRYGNVVSLIQSLYGGFGSGIVGGETGVLLHNRGAYFSLNPQHVNYLQPGKRTMHTLTPAMVLHDNTPYMALGSMGGDAQPQIHVQLLSAMIDFELNVQQAISAPRWRSGRFSVEPAGGSAIELGGQGDVDEHRSNTITEAVVLEQRFPDDVPLALNLLGHQTFVHGAWEDGMGHAQAIVINPDTHVFEGAADPRCDGLALGW
jgi:gamma-glutamyltranspeptidase